MSEGSLRVALLARAGDACDRISEALREAGAELALVADPTTSDESRVRDARPEAIMVALEPAIEDALDGFDGVLSDPAYLVIFEEAELAAQRAGWDAARWLRHLSAKLHRRADVLPPGTENDAEWQPSPGPLPERKEVADLDIAIAAFAGEARQHADEVPRDSGLEGVLGLQAGGDAPSPFDPVAFETGDMAPADDAATPSFDPTVFETGGLSLVEDAPAGDVDAGDGIDAAAQIEATTGEASSPDGGDTAAATAGAGDDSWLSLADADAAPATTAPAADAAQAETLADAFEQRISGLSLADVDSYGHGPERGAVLVEGGLGGPDAVRQLLAAIPAGFPRPVLVRLQLDGGRYDRLVRQMERAASLPVQLAEPGTTAEPGHVYFLPPELGVRRDKARLLFDAAGAAPGLPAALPPDDSALLLLSGASRAHADEASSQAWAKALVAGQSPDGSYDPDAALALMERGGATGTPAELAAMLAERWPPPGAPSPEFEEPQA